jgi:D-alanyl-D-alanine carboxypeptidase (penicillin-binding protein 5/6)
MNQTMRGLGLTRTSFVDASGYSELNVTTPREFASFLSVYLARYGSPESQNAKNAGFNGALEEFHSVKTFSYPLPRNAPNAAPEPARQNTFAATNPALYAIEGCDGVKTGFIPESGYNLSLTVMRNGTRIAAVFMGGPGENTREGNRYRLNDAQTVTRWAFETFAAKKPVLPKAIALSVAGGTENALYLIPAHSRQLTVPAILPGMTAQEAAQSVITEIITAPYTQAPITRGAQAGKIIHSLDGVVLEEIPLVADRTVEKGNAVFYAIDMLAKKMSSKIF